MPYTSGRFQSIFSVTMQDLSDEKSSASIYVPETIIIEDANDNGVPDDPLIANWLTSLQAVCDMTPSRYALLQSLRGAVAVGSGEREQKYLVSYVDNDTAEVFDFEIPCRDTTLPHPPHTDYFDLTVAPWVAFKTNFEALAVSKRGNPVTLTKVRLMGKNN